jgi:anti-sigma regulatory factor (Ser/Thr protein kinase)
MNTMAPTRPTERHRCRVRLTARPAAAAEARSQVSELIWAWQPPVDGDVAVLLTSDLVTNAIRHAAGGTITLAVRCGHGQLRVDVDGATGTGPAQADTPVDMEIGPGLILVATLSDEWGYYRTPAGQAVYFALAFQPGPADDGECGLGKRP